MSGDILRGIEVCVFDAYGTLFDVHSAVGRHRDRFTVDADAVSALWRRKQLEYTWLRSLMGRYEDFARITADALDYAMAAYAVDDPALVADLIEAYQGLDAYPEVPEMLAALKAKGIATAVLSNGSPQMLASAVASAGLGEVLDAVLSVHELGIYKPDPRVYSLATERFGCAAESVSFQSSNAWDANGAAAFGFRVVWVNRFGQPPERLPGEPVAQLSDLQCLPDMIEPR